MYSWSQFFHAQLTIPLIRSCRCLQGLASPATAEVNLDQYVSRIEENPIGSHGGKKRALTEAEKLLLVQQDELRTLREANAEKAPSRSFVPSAPSAQAPSPSPMPAPVFAQTPAVPSLPEVVQPSSQTVTTSPNGAVETTKQDSPLAAINVVGILAAGVLGGLLYQNKQGAKRTEQELKGAVQSKQKVRVHFQEHCHTRFLLHCRYLSLWKLVISSPDCSSTGRSQRLGLSILLTCTVHPVNTQP